MVKSFGVDAYQNGILWLVAIDDHRTITSCFHSHFLLL